MDYMCPHTSSLVQIGGIAALDNMEPVMDIVKYYLENARLVREALDEWGIMSVCAGVGGVCVCGCGCGCGCGCDNMKTYIFRYYGGINAPYTFVHFPGRDSWDVFDEILSKCQVAYYLNPSCTSSSRPHALVA